MTAAVITATRVQKEEVASNLIYGSSGLKLMKLYIQGTKAAQNDWFLLSTYIGATDAANFLHARATTTDSGNATVVEDVTYDSDDYKIDLTSATAGTTWVEVTYYTE